MRKTYKTCRGEFYEGQIIRLEMSENFYQLLTYFDQMPSTPIDKEPPTTCRYLIRKLFNKKLEFKPSLAEVCAEQWFFAPSKAKLEQVTRVIAADENIRAVVEDLNVAPAFNFGVLNVFVMKDNLREELERDVQKFRDGMVDVDQVQAVCLQWAERGLLKPLNVCAPLPILERGTSVYSVLLGRYETDYVDGKPFSRTAKVGVRKNLFVRAKGN